MKTKIIKINQKHSSNVCFNQGQVRRQFLGQALRSQDSCQWVDRCDPLFYVKIGMLISWVKNLHKFTYFYVFIIPSSFFLNALAFQKCIFTKNYIYFLGFRFTYFYIFFGGFSLLKTLYFLRVLKFDANLKLRIFSYQVIFQSCQVFISRIFLVYLNLFFRVEKFDANLLIRIFS